ncbi:hypothetical protein [Rhizobium sp. AN68]|uniref:hypothetical protein n=1 Tax=Rhizobium sp. AN68 TaxID=3035122 RepID=UPI002B26093A|nr:hypothetical protein [Rhizobium sp. AN68]
MFAMIIGPMFSSIIAAIFAVFVKSEEIVSVMSLAFLGWLFGLIPAFVCGVLFANLRGWFGTGYLFAACCGIVGVLPFIYLSGNSQLKNICVYLFGRYYLWLSGNCYAIYGYIISAEIWCTERLR